MMSHRALVLIAALVILLEGGPVTGTGKPLQREEAGPQWVLVNRWFHPGDKDWISLAEGEISDEQLRQWGYVDKKPQFYAARAPFPGSVAVYRWFHPGDKDWISLAEGEIEDAQLQSWGYRDKRLQFYAARRPFRGSVAVYRWFHPGDKDWISLAAAEHADQQLRAWGYTDKKQQFHARALNGEPSPRDAR